MEQGRREQTNANLLETATVLPFGECLLGERLWPLGLPFGIPGTGSRPNTPGKCPRGLSDLGWDRIPERWEAAVASPFGRFPALPARMDSCPWPPRVKTWSILSRSTLSAPGDLTF